MMLARVADSLYWLGRYAERAEHTARLASVMLNAALDRTDAGDEAAAIALAAIGETGLSIETGEAALRLALAGPDSALAAITHARENARQARDQLTTEAWERINLLYLRVSSPRAKTEFAADALEFLQRIVADLHQLKGAVETTMSHGDGWRFLLTGAHIERAQLIARLLETGFGGGRPKMADHLALVSLLRMACALEPYLRAHSSDINARSILEFLMFDEAFPRSIRFSTERLAENLAELGGRRAPARLAGRLNGRLAFADTDRLEAVAGPLLAAVGEDCAAIHAAIRDAFVDYPLEQRLPA